MTYFRKDTDHLSWTQEINQQPHFANSCFGLSEGLERNTFPQNIPSNSNEKSQTQVWRKPKFDQFLIQEDSGSNQNMELIA